MANSKYFTVHEQMCHCGCDENKTQDILLEGLDKLREAIGGPLRCSCMYRCPEHNADVGGVPDSQHVLGLAADVLRPSWLTFDEFAWYVNQYSGADGIGLYRDDDFIHIDYRSYGSEPGEYRWEG